MPTLDPVLHAPQHTGATINMAKSTANEAQWRSEPFAIRPQRVPVRLTGNMKPRPRARSGSGNPASLAIPMARIPVLVRQSNQRPTEEGTGNQGTRWSVSDPAWHALEGTRGMLPGMSDDGTGTTAPAPAGLVPADAPKSGLGMIALLAGIGLGVYLYNRK
jgi:hypothetical protein